MAEHGGGGALDAGLLARVLGGQWRRGDQAGRERVELVEAGGVRRLGVQQLAERGQVARLLGERGAERGGQLLAGGRLGRAVAGSSSGNTTDGQMIPTAALWPISPGIIPASSVNMAW